MRLLTLTATSLLAVAATTAFTLPAQAAPRDSDHDGIANQWERRYGLNPYSKADARLDFDHDGLINRLEYKLRGNPRDEDTDNDGQDDGDERKTRTKVNKADSDGDGVRDGDEDFDRDGIANEDEDDATERCAADDDDRDRERDGDPHRAAADEDHGGQRQVRRHDQILEDEDPEHHRRLAVPRPSELVEHPRDDSRR